MTKAQNKADSTKEQSKATGTVKTDEGKEVEATGPAVPDGAPEVGADSKNEKVRILNWDEQKELLGDLKPGEEGYLPLDADGNITGPAKRGRPPEGQLGAAVMCHPDARPDLLVTPSGAPIAARMNPTFDAPKEATERMEHRAEDLEDK